MKTHLIVWPVFFFIITIPKTTYAQQDAIVGYWLNKSKDAKIEIFKRENNRYYGKLVWLKDSLDVDGKPKKDVNNRDPSLRTRLLKDMILLKGFNKDKNLYTGGTIYDPQNGKTYSCKITFKDRNTLIIRGYVGIPLFGRTTTWTRTFVKLQK